MASSRKFVDYVKQGYESACEQLEVSSHNVEFSLHPKLNKMLTVIHNAIVTEDESVDWVDTLLHNVHFTMPSEAEVSKFTSILLSFGYYLGCIYGIVGKADKLPKIPYTDFYKFLVYINVDSVEYIQTELKDLETSSERIPLVASPKKRKAPPRKPKINEDSDSERPRRKVKPKKVLEDSDSEKPSKPKLKGKKKTVELPKTKTKVVDKVATKLQKSVKKPKKNPEVDISELLESDPEESQREESGSDVNESEDNHYHSSTDIVSN